MIIDLKDMNIIYKNKNKNNNLKCLTDKQMI
jgi:hypothetical protein